MRRLSAPEQLTWKSFREGMLVCHQAFFARRDRAVKYDLHYRFSADFDWCIRIMKQSKILHNTHLTLIDYLNEADDYTQPQGIAERTLSHYVQTLRICINCHETSMVCIATDTSQIITMFLLMVQ